MSERPRASVLMGSFNERPAFLDQAMESILDQTYTDFEVVVVDDGSDDPATCRALDRWTGRDPRLRILRESRRGLTGSLNFGLEHCRGDIILRHDSDDWSAPDRFERQMAFLDAHPDVAVVGTGVMLHREDGAPLWPQAPVTGHDAIVAYFTTGNPFFHGSVAVRRDCLVAQGGYRMAFRVSQDYDCFWRLADRHRVENLPEPLYHHRITLGAISSSLGPDGGQVYHSILAQELGTQRRAGAEDMDKAHSAAGARFRALDLACENRLRQGDRALLAGRSGTSVRLFLQAVRHHPNRLRAWLKLARALMFLAAPPAGRRRLF